VGRFAGIRQFIKQQLPTFRLLRTLLMHGFKRPDFIGQRIISAVLGRGDLAPGHGILVTGLAQFGRVKSRWEHDIGHDALFLRGAAIDTEKLLDGPFQRTQLLAFVSAQKFVQATDSLYRTFTPRRVANDDAASIVLDRSGKNFRGGSRNTIDHDAYRFIPNDFARGTAYVGGGSLGSAHLYDWIGAAQKQATEVGRFA